MRANRVRLDAGALGVMIPKVEGEAEARRAVGMGTYPPRIAGAGTLGALPRLHLLWYGVDSALYRHALLGSLAEVRRLIAKGGPHG